MKRIIVTLCSLVLSLAGSYGINQLASGEELIIDKNTEQIIIEQNTDIIEDTVDLPTDKKTADKAPAKEETAPKAKDNEAADIEDTNGNKEKKNDKQKKNSTIIINDKNDNKSSDIKVNNTDAKKNNTDTKKKSTKNTAKQYKQTPSTTPANNTGNTTAPANNTNNTGSNKGFAQEVLELVNAERAKAGLPALTTNAALKAAADKRAQETKASFSHTRPNGSKFSTVLKEYGISYRTAGENIAYGQRSPQEVVNAWMNSPGHRANILNRSFGKIGIGVYQSGGVIYWTQLFTD